MRIDRDKIELLAATRRVNGAQLAALAGMSRQNLSTIKTRGTCTALSAVKIPKRWRERNATLPQGVKQRPFWIPTGHKCTV